MKNVPMNPSPRIRLLATTALGLLVTLTLPSAVRANPTGGTVVGGNATITNGPGTTTVTQTSNRTIINWEGFSIDKGETTTFVQPNANAVALNRVTGSEASMLNGTLNANGKVFLINRNGVVVGQGAHVNVGGLVATTTDIADQAFMSGSDRFDRPTGNPDAKVVNQGTITVADHGLAALVGPTVENSGVIAAKLGTVALGSAETFTVDLAGDGLISFDTGQAVNRTGGSAQVSNAGTIDAAGGTVILSAGQAASVVDNAIDMSGVITAKAVGMDGGTIVLSGGEGTTVVTGTIDASGTAAGAKGGTVEITGGTVALASTATVDASGRRGGGTVKIGGDRQGTGGTPTAQKTLVAKGAVVDASAKGRGDGGTVIVWSEQLTRFDGTVKARGGTDGGNGGFVETSSRGTLSIGTGRVDAGAAKGLAGNWLLDPTNVTITDDPLLLADPNGAFSGGDPNAWLNDAGAIDSFIDVAAIEASLNSSTDVTITTNSAGGLGAGIISLMADLDTAVGSTGGDGQATLTMEAFGGIALNNGFGITNTAGLLVVNLQIAEGPAGTPPGFTRDINIGDVTADGGDIFLVADASYIGDGGGRVFFSGDFTTQNGGNATIYAHGNVVEVDGTIDINALSVADLDLGPLGLGGLDLPAGAFFDAIAAPVSSGGDEFTPSFVTGNLASIAVRDGTDGTAATLTIASSNLSFATSAGVTLPGRISAPTVVLSGAPGQGVFLNPIGAGAGLNVFTPELEAFDFSIVKELQLGRLADTTTVAIGGGLDAAALGNADLILTAFAQSNILVGEPAGAVAAIDTVINVGTLNLFTGDDSASSIDIGTRSTTRITADAIEMGLAPGLTGDGVPNTITIGAGFDVTMNADTMRIGRVQAVAGEPIDFQQSVGSTLIGVQSDVTLNIGDTIIYTDNLNIGGATVTTIQGFDRFLAFGREGFSDAVIRGTDGSFDGQTVIDGFANSLFSLEYDSISIGDSSGTGAVTITARDIDLLSRSKGVFIEDTASLTADNDFRVALGQDGELLINGTTQGDDVTFMAYFLGQDTVVGEDAGGLHAMYDQADIDAFAGADDLTVTSRSIQAGGTPVPDGDSAVILSFNATTPTLQLPVDTVFSTVGSFGTGNIQAGTAAQAVAVTGQGDIAFETKAGGTTTFAGTFATTGGDIGVQGPALIDGPTSITASGGVGFAGPIDATSAAAVSDLSLAGNTAGVFLLGPVGSLRPLDSLTVTGGAAIELAGVATTGNQFYFAPNVLFGTGAYVSSGGNISSASAGVNRIDGAVTIEAAGDVEFSGRVDGAGGAGDSLTVIAETGRAGFFSAVGAVNPFDTLDVTAGTEALFTTIRTLGDATIEAPIVSLAGSIVDIGGALDITGDVETLVDATITAAGSLTVRGNIDLSSAADFGADLDLESTGAGVLVTGDIGSVGPLDNLTVTAATDIDVGSARTNADQTYTAPLVTLRGASYQAGGSVTVDGATRLDGITQVDAGGSILFTGTIDREAGAGSLVANAGPAGDVTVQGRIGGINRLGSVNLTAGDQVSVVGADTVGDQDYSGGLVALAGTYDSDNGSITVTGPAAIDGPVAMVANQDIGFSGPIDAAPGVGHSLAATAEEGSVAFAAPIGGSRPLDSVTADAGTAIEADDITTRGFIDLAAPAIDLQGGSYVAGSFLTFTGAVNLGNDTLIEADDAVTVDGSIDGDGTDLAIVSNNAGVDVTGPIGSSEAIDELSVSAATTIAVQNARTGGSQTYTGPSIALNGENYEAGGDVAVNGDTTLDGETTVDAGGSIRFAGTIDASSAAARLTAVAGDTGDVTVEDVIGGTARLASVSLTAGDQVSVDGANTVGNQRYEGAGVALAGSFDSDSGNFTVAGPATVSGPVTVVAGNAAAFTGTLDAAAGGGGLTVTAEAGDLTFAGAVGGTRAVDGLTARAGGTLTTASITSADEVELTGDRVVLEGDRFSAGTELKLAGAVEVTRDTLLSGSGAVIVDGTIDRSASAIGRPNLEIESANSGVVLLGAVGATRTLGDLTVDADVDAFLADVSVAGDLIVLAPEIALTGSAYSALGGLVFSGDTTAANDTSIAAADGVTVAGTLDTHEDAPAPVDVDITSSGGSVGLLGEVGGNRRLASLEVTAGEISLESGVHTTGDQRYTAPVINLSTGTYDSSAGSVDLDGNLLLLGGINVEADQDLTITGSIDSAGGDADGLRGRITLDAGGTLRVLGPVGTDEALGSFSLTAGTAIDPPSVITIGPQFYSAPTILLTGTQYRTNGGSFTTIGDVTFSAASVTISTNILTAAAGDLLMDGHVTGNDVFIDAGEASITALDVEFASLSVAHVTGSADMGGTIGGLTGSDAAEAVGRPDGIADTYLFNGCVMAVGCAPPIDSRVTSQLDFELANPFPVLYVTAPPLIVSATDAFIDDPRFVFSNTGKDALWRLDLDEPAPAEEEAQ